MRNEKINDVSEVNDDDGLENGTDQIEDDDKTHTETAETTETGDTEENEEIVDGGVDPATTLREEDCPLFGCCGPCSCVSDVFCPQAWVVF
jgi:hypothetical protein